MGVWSPHPSVRFAGLAAVVGLACCLSAGGALALSLEQQQYIDFGSIVITDNSAARSITIAPTGTITSDPEVLVVVAGQPATYKITGGPASTVLDFAFTSASVDPIGDFTPRTFTIDTHSTDSDRLTDAGGELTFNLGATLTTDGAGGTYGDGVYQGLYIISINF